MQVTIYHNPRCSKSRQTLALLEENGLQPSIVRYLETPPDEQELRGLLTRLGMTARELVRTGEKAYADLELADAGEDELLAAMTAHPELIQRPIVVAGDKARLGRPPESVLEIVS